MYLVNCIWFFAFGDFLGVKTKAKLSSVFVAQMLFLVLFMAGVLPPDLIEIAGLSDVSRMSLSFLVFNMGTTVNLSQMRKEWRVVLMDTFAMLVAMGLAFAVIIGRQVAIVSIPIVNGGLDATQIMTTAALDAGFATAVAETQDEKDYIIKKLSPAFVVSGFVSITTISILAAGVFAKFI